MEARFKKARHTVFYRGPRGVARLAEPGVLLAYDDGQATKVPYAALTKAALNRRNGLWTFHFQDGAKLTIQTAGWILWHGDRASGRRFNEALIAGLAANGVACLSI